MAYLSRETETIKQQQIEVLEMGVYFQKETIAFIRWPKELVATNSPKVKNG